METHLIEMLDSLAQCNWQQQIAIIEQLPMDLTFVKLINHRNYSLILAEIFTQQFNPRSKLITTLCEFLIEVFVNYSNSLVDFANKLISHGCLLKLLGNGNKVISCAVNELCKTIILHTNYSQHRKHIKFVSSLENQFTCSKNNYVRQQISMYFQVIFQNQFYLNPHSFYQKILQPARYHPQENVRINIQSIIQIYHSQYQENKENFHAESQCRNKSKSSSARKSQVTVNNQVKMSERIQSSSSLKHECINLERKSNINEWEANAQFCLNRILGDQPWHIKQTSLKQLSQMILDQSFLQQKHINMQLIHRILEALIGFLQEKRNKCYLISADCILQVLHYLNQMGNSTLMAVLQDKYSVLITHVIKHQDIAQHFIDTIFKYSPFIFISAGFHIVHTQIKNSQQQILFLRILTSALHLIPITTKNNSKIKSMIKELCAIIEDNHDFQKEREQCCRLCVEILAKIEQIGWKLVVVETMIGLDNKLLKRIILIAEEVNCHQLKQSIYEYINSMKNKQKESTSHFTPTLHHQQGCLEIEIQKVKLGHQSIQHLAEIMFSQNLTHSKNDFSRLFTLCSFLLQKDILLQYRILLQELSKMGNKKFIDALLSVISDQQNDQDIHLSHKVMFLHVLEQSLKVYQENIIKSNQIDTFSLWICTSLIKVYRKENKEVQIRQRCIKCLILFEDTVIGQCMNEKQIQLVLAFRAKLTTVKLSI